MYVCARRLLRVLRTLAMGLCAVASCAGPSEVAAAGPAGSFDVLFLGSGVSTGVPRIGCIVRPDQSLPVCRVCHDAMRAGSRNRRGNVSILVRFWHADGRPRHIMVGGQIPCIGRRGACRGACTDCGPLSRNLTTADSHAPAVFAQVDAGKTMREQCMRLLPRHGIRNLDALLITHAHADAIHGLDDIRDFQQQGTRHLALPPLPVYVTNTTFSDIRQRFGYLVPGSGSQLEKESAAAAAAQGAVAAGPDIKTNVRTVSKLDWRVLPEPPLSVSELVQAAGGGGVGGRDTYPAMDLPECSGLAITPLPVSLTKEKTRDSEACVVETKQRDWTDRQREETREGRKGERASVGRAFPRGLKTLFFLLDSSRAGAARWPAGVPSL